MGRKRAGGEERRKGERSARGRVEKRRVTNKRVARGRERVEGTEGRGRKRSIFSTNLA